jgi:hypothetical protein
MLILRFDMKIINFHGINIAVLKAIVHQGPS